MSVLVSRDHNNGGSMLHRGCQQGHYEYCGYTSISEQAVGRFKDIMATAIQEAIQLDLERKSKVKVLACVQACVHRPDYPRKLGSLCCQTTVGMAGIHCC
jgi:hypothetical protein